MPAIDLSRPLDAATWTYPGDPQITVEPRSTIDLDGYRVSALGMGTHAGTHLDAPSHTEPEGATVDELPVETFASDAALIDLDLDASEPITPSRLSAAPEPVDLLVLDTGWAAHWSTDRYLDHPHLSVDAAEWCADRGLSVAIDAPSVDPSIPADEAEDVDVDDDEDEVGAEAGGAGVSDGLTAHHALLGGGCLIVENLTGLAGLPPTFELRAYPLPIADGDGSPVRAVAVF